MAIGGFLGSALAGLSGYDRAQQEAQQNQYRQLQMRLQQQEYQQRLQQQRQEQEGLNAAFGTLRGLGGLGGAPPLQQMPQTPMPQTGGGDGLAPGFARDPSGMLTRNGRPPDTYLGGRGGATPAWLEGTQSGQGVGGGLAAGGAATRSGYDLPALMRLASQAGFSPEAAPKMAAISMAESSGNPGAINPKDPGGSYGLTQINAKAHGAEYAKAALKPEVAMSEAFDISKGGTDFNPWSTYKSGAYKQFMEKTLQGGQALAQQVSQDIDPRVQGRAGLAQLAAAVEKAAPNADGATKMLAVMHLEKLLAPYDKLQFQQYMKENQQAIQLALKDMQIQAANARQDKGIAASEEKGTGQVIQRGDKFFQMTPSGPREIQFPGEGAVSKVGSASQSGISPETSKFMAEGIANYQLPPLSGWALKSPNGQSLMAEVMKINPKYDATEYTAKQSGARAVGTRSKTLEMATGVAEELIPLAQETSDKINRTQFPTVNAMIIAADKGTGGEDVVRFLDQLNSLKYAYARALNPTGQARVEDLKRFDDILDTSWSKGQVRAALDQMRQSLAAERRGIEKTRNKSEGGAPPEAPAAPAKSGPIKVDDDGNPVQ